MKVNQKVNLILEGTLNTLKMYPGIAKKNIEFLKNEKINIEGFSWPINNIKIYNELNDKKEILNFGPAQDKLFSIIKYYKFFDFLQKKIKKNK